MIKDEKAKKWFDEIKQVIAEATPEDIADAKFKVNNLIKKFEEQLIIRDKTKRNRIVDGRIIEKWKQMKNSGASYNQIAAEQNVAISTVRYHLNDKDKARMIEAGKNYIKKIESDPLKKKVLEEKRKIWAKAQSIRKEKEKILGGKKENENEKDEVTNF